MNLRCFKYCIISIADLRVTCLKTSFVQQSESSHLLAWACCQKDIPCPGKRAKLLEITFESMEFNNLFIYIGNWKPEKVTFSNGAMKLNTFWSRMASVAGAVIQATGRTELEDGTRPGGCLNRLHAHCGICTSPTVMLNPLWGMSWLWG